jgi:hypothetical protein
MYTITAKDHPNEYHSQNTAYDQSALDPTQGYEPLRRLVFRIRVLVFFRFRIEIVVVPGQSGFFGRRRRLEDS